MSDPTSIFGNSNPEATPPAQGGAGTPPNVQPDSVIATLLSEIKNERGEPKYKNVQDAIVALKHSQEFIPQLTEQVRQREADLVTARAEAARAAELERSLEALTQRRENTPPQGSPSLTPEQIAELVTQTLTNRQKQELATQNMANVANTLSASFGTEAERKYNEKAAELGMTVPELNALAARSPKAVLDMLGAKTPTPSGAPPQSSANTAGFQTHQDSFVGRNSKGVILGATTEDMRREMDASNKMVDELHAQGKSVYDLSDPKVYMKHFGK